MTGTTLQPGCVVLVVVVVLVLVVVLMVVVVLVVTVMVVVLVVPQGWRASTCGTSKVHPERQPPMRRISSFQIAAPCVCRGTGIPSQCSHVPVEGSRTSVLVRSCIPDSGK